MHVAHSVLLREFAVGMVVQFVSYTNLTINYRAVAHAQVPYAVASDAAASMISYLIVRRIVKSDSPAMMVGMMVGGGLASWFGIWLTRAWT